MELYHSDLFEKRKTWQVDPLIEVIKFCKDRKGQTLQILDVGLVI